MSDDKTIKLEQEKVALEKQNADLTVKLEKAEADIEQLKAEKETAAKENEAFTKHIEKLRASVEKLQRDAEVNEVEGLVAQAIEARKDASLFEGFDKAEDKLAWVEEKFGTVRAMRTVLEHLPAEQTTETSSGKSEETETEDPGEQFAAEIQRIQAEENLDWNAAEEKARKTKPELFERLRATY